MGPSAALTFFLFFFSLASSPGYTTLKPGNWGGTSVAASAIYFIADVEAP